MCLLLKRIQRWDIGAELRIPRHTARASIYHVARFALLATIVVEPALLQLPLLELNTPDQRILVNVECCAKRIAPEQIKSFRKMIPHLTVVIAPLKHPDTSHWQLPNYGSVNASQDFPACETAPRCSWLTHSLMSAFKAISGFTLMG